MILLSPAPRYAATVTSTHAPRMLRSHITMLGLVGAWLALAVSCAPGELAESGPEPVPESAQASPGIPVIQPASNATGAALAITTQALTRITSFGSNPGNLDMYVYAPAGMPANAPLVVALHGCSQSAASYVHAGWNQLAELWKFYVLYPQQKSDNNPIGCFNWAGEYGDTANLTRGQGENLSIKQMVDTMKTSYSIDASRVFITGLSAGAAFANVMLATWPDVFAGGAIMAGVPFRCATSVNGATRCMSPGETKTAAEWGALVRNAYPGYSGPYPRVSIWHGDQDTTVRSGNLIEQVKQWAHVHGIDQTPDAEDTVAGYPHKMYRNAAGEVLVETYTITGMGHGTAVDPQYTYPGSTLPCGAAGSFILDANICSTYYAAKFFGLDRSDSTAPSVAITAPGSGATLSGMVAVTVQATDDMAVAKVELYLDGVLAYTDTSAPYGWSWDAATTPSGAHSLVAKAYDTAGNTALSAAVPVTVIGGISDITPPTVSITFPAAEATVYGTVDITARAQDDVGVSRVEFYLDGALLGVGTPSEQAGPYTLSWNTMGTASGAHVLTARARDAAGNTGQSASVSITVDQSAQTFRETFSSAGPDQSGWNLSQFALDDADRGGVVGSQSLYGTAQNASGGTTVKRASVSGVVLGAQPRLGYARRLDLRAQVNTSTRAEFRVIVHDGVEHVVDEMVITYANYQESTWTDRQSIDLSAYANRTVTLIFEVKAVNNVWMPVSASVHLDDIRIGPPDDSADVTAPLVSITAPGSGATLSGTTEVQVSAQDTVGVTKVELYIDGSHVGTDTAIPYAFTWNTSSSGNGGHTLLAKAYDAANNVGSASVAVTVSNAGGGPVTTSVQGIAAEDGYVKASANGSSAVIGYYSTLAVGRGSDGKFNRAIVSFDTAGLPDSATITRAYLTVSLSSSSGDPWASPADNTLVIDIKNGCFGACSTETSDWGAAATAAAVAHLVKFPSGTQRSSDISAAGLAAINKTGRTQLRLRFAQDQSSTAYLFLHEGASFVLHLEYQ